MDHSNTTPKTPKTRKKKDSGVQIRYTLDVFTDKELKEYRCSPIVRSHDKKLARKDMMEIAHKHLVKGKYYFYRLIEERKTQIEIYPS
jgi:hypothetical protein